MTTTPPVPSPQTELPDTEGHRSPLPTYGWVIIVVVVGLLAAGLTWLVMRGESEDGAGSLESPSVIGFTIERATTTIEGAGLQVGEITLQPSEVDNGLVLEQNPPAATSLAPGSRINLVVSGDANPIVPDLQSFNETDAVNALITVGLRAGEITQTSSSEAAGQVVAQSIPAGEQVDAGTTVDLRVSSGRVGVADVVGLTTAEAKAALRNEGFKIQEQEQTSDQVGVVLSQSPEAGAEAAVGSTVVITVGTSPTPTPTPTPTPVDQAVCGRDVLTKAVEDSRDSGATPVQGLQDFICVGGWAVAIAQIGEQPDQIVLDRFIFTADGTDWNRVSRNEACADGSDLPEPLRPAACADVVG
jgi:beta-lactam-binding protein with PASTA domain